MVYPHKIILHWHFSYRTEERNPTTEHPTIGISARKRHVYTPTTSTALPTTKITLTFGTTRRRYWWRSTEGIGYTMTPVSTSPLQTTAATTPRTTTRSGYVHVNKITGRPSQTSKYAKPVIKQYDAYTTKQEETTSIYATTTKHPVHLLFSHDDFGLNDQHQPYTTADSTTYHPVHLLFSHDEFVQKAPVAPKYSATTPVSVGFVTKYELPDYLKTWTGTQFITSKLEESHMDTLPELITVPFSWWGAWFFYMKLNSYYYRNLTLFFTNKTSLGILHLVSLHRPDQSCLERRLSWEIFRKYYIYICKAAADSVL